MFKMAVVGGLFLVVLGIGYAGLSYFTLCCAPPPRPCCALPQPMPPPPPPR
jgi:hypothetical protein